VKGERNRHVRLCDCSICAGNLTGNMRKHLAPRLLHSPAPLLVRETAESIRTRSVLFASQAAERVLFSVLFRVRCTHDRQRPSSCDQQAWRYQWTLSAARLIPPWRGCPRPKPTVLGRLSLQRLKSGPLPRMSTYSLPASWKSMICKFRRTV